MRTSSSCDSLQELFSLEDEMATEKTALGRFMGLRKQGYDRCMHLGIE
jgi:hypothetical protein